METGEIQEGIVLGGYYRFYAGDYLKDTLELTMEQDGAYRRLLDHYYSGKTIPEDVDKVFRIARAYKKSEQNAVVFVLKNYFFLNGGRYVNRRADAEIDRMRKWSESQSEKGKLGGRPKKPGLLVG